MGNERHTIFAGSAQLVDLTSAELPTLIELMPLGDIRLGDERGHVGQLVDPAAVIARSFETATAKMLPIDFDHGIDGDSTHGTLAAGWITALEVQGNRIMATVEWSDAGKAALKGRNYRFISPTFTTNPDTNDVVRILRAGLTNNPALPELKQIASRQEDPDMPKWLTTLAEKLGMPDETDEAKILAAAETAIETAERAASIVTAAGLEGDLDETAATAIEAKLTAAAKPVEETVDPTKYVPMDLHKQTAARLKALEDKTSAKEAEALVTAAMQDGKITPAQKDWALKAAAQDPAFFEDFVSTAPVVVKGGKVLATIEPPKDGQLDDEEKKIIASMPAVSEEAYLAMKQGKPLPKTEKEA